MPVSIPPIYSPAISEASVRWNVPPNIIAAVLQVESGFNPNARSSAGAEGIAQFMPGTAASLGIDPFNPSQSIDAAGRYLSQQYARFGNWTEALAAYNAGPGAKNSNPMGWSQGLGYAAKVLGLAGQITGVAAANAPTESAITPANAILGDLNIGSWTDFIVRALLIILGIILVMVGIWTSFGAKKTQIIQSVSSIGDGET